MELARIRSPALVAQILTDPGGYALALKQARKKTEQPTTGPLDFSGNTIFEGIILGEVLKRKRA